MKTKSRSVSMLAIAIATLGTILFTLLLIYGEIGEISYVTLLCVLALTALVLHGFPRIRELDLRNLKMTLDRIEEVKAEVFAKEADLRNIAISLAKTIAFINVFQGRYGSMEANDLKRKWHRLQTNKLLDILSVDPNSRTEILKYDLYFQNLPNIKTDEEKKGFRDGFLNMIRADLESSN